MTTFRPGSSSADRFILQAMFSPQTTWPPSESHEKALVDPGLSVHSSPFRTKAASGSRLDPRCERRLRCRANLDVGHFAILENHQRRDGADTETSGNLRILIDIQLGDLHLTSKIC